ncbi:MAG: SET domain-containing protein-lysine N-methyltransferase [Draconibacterium sp.]|nr:SET domain-containing protein-lysine N-methyltransferase [Draconibacterium sp.]
MTIKLTDSEALYFYVEDSDIHGKGLFAKTPIKAGTYLGDYEGPETTKNGMHVLWIEEEDGKWIGRDGKNALRYLNHDRNPCAEFDGFELYAAADIKPHQEITIDYGEEP